LCDAGESEDPFSEFISGKREFIVWQPFEDWPQSDVAAEMEDTMLAAFETIKRYSGRGE
jgi:hypothetical protein